MSVAGAALLLNNNNDFLFKADLDVSVIVEYTDLSKNTRAVTTKYMLSRGLIKALSDEDKILSLEATRGLREKGETIQGIKGIIFCGYGTV